MTLVRTRIKTRANSRSTTRISSREDRIVNGIVYVACALVAVVCVFPLLFVVAASITPYGEVLRNGGYIVIPRAITFDAYRELLADPAIPRALSVTAFITVVGTALNMLLTTLMAYPLSRRDLPGRSAVLLIALFTTVFGAGMIPTYLIVKATGLLDTVWAMIVPGAVSVFNVLIMKTFFEGIPDELVDAARIDGAGELRILVQVILPLSVPVMLTLGLFYGVSHWNEFFQAILYVRDPDLQPLQVVVRNLLARSQATENADAVLPLVTVQMAAVVVAAIPMIAVYPFVQKHFQKGVLLGSVKG
ncbi:carbohydrate ABC transporter permease [Kribbella amoyensis]|uniref:carbohydrate ABC transporter permease n=1 Tax=Kribbella amoyensis TaxID=996641 RepID=UPI00192DF5A2|nr:carbohydrate ABC transporter permease [Kribbella amoyensis]